ncbi:phosphotransferase family protein [Bacillus sp. SD088]|uniref:phosphotransferase family protein n=1 Tax=Bacillus sp. SD088 TaxID=2782012 RepID=UPI0037BEB11F
MFTEHQFVFCHGDLWGGNLIQKGTDIHVIDWESAILAPREYDLFNYMVRDLRFYSLPIKKISPHQ